MAGADRLRLPRTPRLPALVAITGILVVALAATFLTHAGDDGIDAALLNDPALQFEPPTTTTAPATTVAADATPEVVVPDPLDGLVPGFEGTLVMTAWLADALELWTWSSGPGGTLTREPIAGNLLDAQPSPAGDRVAALLGEIGDAWLVVTKGTEVVPVFFGARSFAWHSTDPARIAWLSQTSPSDAPTLYVGARNDGGLYFTEVATLDSLSASAGEPAARLVGYDSMGFVVEVWTPHEGTIVPSVERLDSSGRQVAIQDGTFVAISPSGGLAVSGFGTTDITVSGTSVPVHLPVTSTSAAWAPDGLRLATTPEGATGITIADGTTGTFIDVGLSHLRVLTWSADGRFVVVAGQSETGRALAFVDTDDGSVRAVAIEASPIGAVVTP